MEFYVFEYGSIKEFIVTDYEHFSKFEEILESRNLSLFDLDYAPATDDVDDYNAMLEQAYDEYCTEIPYNEYLELLLDVNYSKFLLYGEVLDETGHDNYDIDELFEIIKLMYMDTFNTTFTIEKNIDLFNDYGTTVTMNNEKILIKFHGDDDSWCYSLAKLIRELLKGFNLRVVVEVI